MVDDISFTQLATLVEVAEAGSFAGAARTLGVTRAAVSKRILDLEDELGVRLVQRTTRKVSLTDVGHSVVERARRMRAEAEEAYALARNESDGPRGLLRVTAPLGLGQRFVGPALARFAERHPKLSAELVLSDESLDLIGHSIDVAVRGGKLASSSLKARKIGPLTLLVCGSPRYLRTHGMPKTPKDLLHHRWVVLTPMGRPQKTVFEGSDGRTTVRLDGPLAANDGEVVRGWVEHGLGLALLPRFWVESDLADGRLVHVLPKYQVRGGALWALHPYETHVPAKVSAFVDSLKNFSPALS